VVDSLKVTGYSNNSGWVSVYLKIFWQDTSYRYRSLNGSEEYDFGFLGDRYLFEKKYGKIQLSKDDIPVLLGQQYIAPTIHFIIRQDSVRHIIKYYCPDKKDENEEKVFTKVEVLVRYKSGIKQLQYEMESAFKKTTSIKMFSPRLCVDLSNPC